MIALRTALTVPLVLLAAVVMAPSSSEAANVPDRILGRGGGSGSGSALFNNSSTGGTGRSGGRGSGEKRKRTIVGS